CIAVGRAQVRINSHGQLPAVLMAQPSGDRANIHTQSRTSRRSGASNDAKNLGFRAVGTRSPGIYAPICASRWDRPMQSLSPEQVTLVLGSLAAKGSQRGKEGEAKV